jgi:hypothetical protein
MVRMVSGWSAMRREERVREHVSSAARCGFVDICFFARGDDGFFRGFREVL